MEILKMRLVWVFGLFGFLLVVSTQGGFQDSGKSDPKKDAKSASGKKTSDGKGKIESDEPASERRTELIEEFKKVLNEEPTVAESKSIILLAPKSSGKRAQEWVKTAEKHRDLAVKTLAMEDDEVQETKLGIFLWTTQDQLRNHIRRVEHRSTDKDDTSVLNTEDWVIRAAGIIPPSREGALGDHRAGELVAGLVLARHAKRAASVPDWLTQGFGRATTWKLANQNSRPLMEEKRKAVLLSRKFNGWEVLNGETGATDAAALQASAIYYMAFVGTFAPKFPKFVEGFQPDDNNNPRGIAQAMTYAGIDPGTFGSSWKSWAGR